MDHAASPVPPTGEGARGFRCGEVEVWPALNLLRNGEEETRLGSVVMDLLVALVRRRGEPASKDDLIAEVWQGRSVSDDALTAAIYELRKALGDRARSPSFIETIPGRGYRWLPAVEWLASGERSVVSSPLAADPGPEAPAGHPETPRRSFRFDSVPALLLGLALVGLVAVGLAVARWMVDKPEAVALDSTSAVAVLPFSDYSPNREAGDRTFADGMTDSFILELARASPIRVLSRTSAMRFGDSREPLPEIARQLGADLLIEGMVLREGKQLRIGLQLIDGRADHHLWAYSSEVGVERALDVQVELAAATASEIRKLLGGRGGEIRPANLGPASGPMPEPALDAYLRGLDELRQVTTAGLERAVPAFREAVAMAPGHSVVWARLSEAHTLRFEFGLGDADQEMELARSTADRALALDPGSPIALHSRGLYQYAVGWDLEAAEETLRRSLASDPMYAPSWQTLTWLLMARLRSSEAVAAARRAVQADPRSEFAHLALGTALWVDGESEAAERWFAEHSDADTLLGQLMAHKRLRIFLWANRPTDAWTALRGLSSFPSEDAARLESLWLEGRSEAVLRELLDRDESEGKRDFSVILSHVWVADFEGALDHLEALVETRHPDSLLLNFYPTLQPLHGHPRFEALLEKVGLPRPAG